MKSEARNPKFETRRMMQEIISLQATSYQLLTTGDAERAL
jgi:hypothetical protein